MADDRNTALLLDMKLSADDALSFVRDIDFTEFSVSKLHQNAVVRSLEIIGEAAGKVSAEFCEAHPEIAWRDITGMRHRLIHDYNNVQIEVVWNVLASDLPKLIAALAPLIPVDPTAQ